jgi:hypothetical protein
MKPKMSVDSAGRVERRERSRLPLLGTAHHHIDPRAVALTAHQPRRPIRHGRLGAVSLRHFGRIRLDMMAAVLTPYDEPQVSSCGAAKRRRRARPRFHRTACAIDHSTAAAH